ncbi:hypothetical protein DHD08_06025 [Arenibacter sp. H213]|nr:hypothetical protein [Arenibacter sp. H213]
MAYLFCDHQLDLQGLKNLAGLRIIMKLKPKKDIAAIANAKISSEYKVLSSEMGSVIGDQ